MNLDPPTKNKKNLVGPKTKRTKIIWISSTSFLFLLIVLFLFLDVLTKNILEKIGSNYLGVPVQIESLSLQLFKGTIVLQECNIQTGDGFKQKNICTIDKIELSFDSSSLFSDTIILHKIRLKNPHFYYEQSDHTDNISSLIQHIEENDTTPKTQTNTPSKKIQIKQIDIPQFFIDVTFTTHPEYDIQLSGKKLLFNPTTQKLHLENITLKNPKKIITSHLFTLNALDIDFNFNSSKTTESLFQNILISAPHIFIEKNKTTGTIQEYLALIQAICTPKTTAHTHNDTPAKPSSSPFPINNLKIQDAQIHLITPQQPKQNVHVDIKQLQYSFSSGLFKLNKLALSNPATIKTPHLFELQTATLQIHSNPQPSTDPAFIIHHAHFSKLYFFLEHNYSTDTLSEWRKLIQSLLKKTTPIATTQPNKNPSTKKTPFPVQLKDIKIEDIQVRLAELTAINPPKEPLLRARINRIDGTFDTGNLSLQKIILKNPKGYLQKNLLEIEEINTTFNPKSLYNNTPLILHQLTVQSPTINLEQTKTSGNFIEWNQNFHHFFLQKKSKKPLKKTVKKVPSTPSYLFEKVTINQFQINMTSPLVEPKILNRFAKKINPLQLLQTAPTPTLNTSKTMSLLSITKGTIEPPKGFVRIEDLKLANPPGFSRTHMLAITDTQINFSPQSLNTKPIQIKNILINKPRVSFERQLSVDNFQIFPEFLMAAIKKPRETIPERPILLPKQAPKETEKLIINHVTIQGGIVHAKISKLPSAPIPLPKIEIKNIGTKEGGASIPEALTKIYSTFYDSMINSVSRVTGMAKTTLKNVTTFGIDTIGTFGQGISNTTKKIFFFKKNKEKK